MVRGDELKMILFNKLSKKKQKEINKKHRTFWLINPTPRIKPSGKVYDRKKRKNNLKENKYV